MSGSSINGYLQPAAGEQAVFLHLPELISYLRRRRVVTLLTLAEPGILGSDRSTPIRRELPGCDLACKKGSDAMLVHP